MSTKTLRMRMTVARARELGYEPGMDRLYEWVIAPVEVGRVCN